VNKTWEDFISLNSQKEPNFELLEPAKYWRDNDSKRAEFDALNLGYEQALELDTVPLPATKDREGYFGPHHFGYWASGSQDAKILLDIAHELGIETKSHLDLGCASGRVIRHIRSINPNIDVFGCDINRLHAEWCNLYLPAPIRVFHSSSIPNLPLASNSLDVVSAYSVFTHIEAFETAWLMELSRVLRPGGLAYITVHTDHTLYNLRKGWPLWKSVMGRSNITNLLDESRNFKGNRLILRWLENASYSSNIFYKTRYLWNVWSRFLDIVEIRRRFPRFQDVVICRAK